MSSFPLDASMMNPSFILVGTPLVWSSPDVRSSRFLSSVSQNHDPKIAAVARSISDKLPELRSFPDSHQRLLPSKPPQLQFYTSDPVAPPTTNHELFKDTVPRPFYYEHNVRAPFTVGCQYRPTDDTTVTAQITQTPEMVNPTKSEREVIPPTLHTVAQVENKNGLLRDKTVITTAEATMARGRVFQKSAEVFVNK